MSDTSLPVFPGICNTVNLTVATLLDQFLTVIPDMKQVYDENLSYGSTVTKFRSDNQLKNQRVDFFPCFSFRRSVMRYTTPAGPGHRSIVLNSTRQIAPLNKFAETYHQVQADFDIEFQYYTRSIERLTEFELTYLTEDGISKFKQFSIDLTPLTGGPFNFFADFLPLESLAVKYEDNGNYYKAVTGKITIRGWYFILMGQSPLIQSIQKRISDFNTRVLLEQETITS